jgi:FkbM family methyltransferase
MAGEGVEAHAFEANPYNYQAFVGRIKESAPAVHYHHLAISDTDGEVTFHVKESKGDKALNKVAGNNSLLVRSDDSFLYEKVTVPSRRLDSFLAEGGLTGRTFSAWIDVEGALGPVTKGFGGALETCLSLMVEVEEVAYWQGQMLVFDAMRYFAEQGLVPVARDFEYSDQFNLVYLRKDMLLHPEVRLTLTKFLQST